MKVPPGTDPSIPDPTADDEAPMNWREAAGRLVCARIDIIQIELADVLRTGSRKAILLGVAVFALLATWILALAGGIGAVGAANDWPWYWVALGAAGLHLLAAVACALFASRKGPEAFPFTRAEFQKDRECIERKKSRKSNA